MEQEQEKEKRDFKGVWIPKEIWLNAKLTALEKIILMEINSLDNDAGCFATNEYLAEFCQCSESKVSKSISKLKKLNYISIKSFDGRQRILTTNLRAVNIDNKTEKIEKKVEKNDIVKNDNLAQNASQGGKKCYADKHKMTGNTNNKDNNIDLENNNKPPLSPLKPKGEINLDFILPEHLEIFSLWLDYKKEKGQRYKGETSIKICYNKLVKLAGGSVEKMREIVENSIMCNYAGLFPLSEPKKATGGNFTQKNGNGNNVDLEELKKYDI